MSTLDKASDSYIKKDRMRYEKNKQSADLAILSIVFNALFFISIYKSNMGSYYYTLLMGASIVYNLLFMLIVFLVSEGSKNYQINYSYIAIPVALLQFVRLFIYPRMAHSADITISETTTKVMGNAQYTRCIIYLVLSGALLLLSAIIGIKKCNDLKAHLASIEQNN